jgi:multisubunit Na+/H+ antiporter MnhG subunit
MSWPRAVLAGAVVVLIAFAALVYVPDLLVSMTGVGRSTRVAMATVWFTVSLCALLWGLRKLQARGLR